ncbi:c-type cytochrome [Endozoicomonas sp.]|uniref:c-type cytochrome n=1 Tax=Endozoicomonas sp. TaxID=1892382 RepID=UPI002884E6B6|nr:cytochrome c [Endozoicomonas sp.]
MKHCTSQFLLTGLLFLTLWTEAAPGFGLGTEASVEEVAAWDIDVRPDGMGLPADKGGNAIQGRIVYQQHCQHCHGDNGLGGPYDRLVGRLEKDSFPFAKKDPPEKTIGNYWPWATTVFDYIRRSMPYTTPGSLTDNEVYSLTAYLLYANGIIPEGMTLDASNLATIEMPARHRFIPDNRTETHTVR